MEALHGPGARDAFLQRLDKDLAKLVLSLGRPVSYERGEVISRQGDAADNVLLIRTGVVKITTISMQGDEAILGFRGTGELLGEYSALQGLRRSGNVVGHHPGTVLKISSADFGKATKQHPPLLLAILAVSGARLRQSDLQRLSYASHDVPCRIAATLLAWASEYGIQSETGVVIGLNASRKELAQAVAASEKTVDDGLTALRRSGLVDTGWRKLVIVDMERLQRWLEDRLST